MKIFFRLGIIVILLAGISSCRNAGGKTQEVTQEIEATDTFFTLYPKNYEDKFTIISLDEITKIHNGRNINLSIVNNTSDCIMFPPDFDVHLYLQQNGEWMEITNNVFYYGSEDIELRSKKHPYYYSQDLPITPIYPFADLDEDAVLRVVATGRVCEKGIPTENETSAYVDFKALP